jgi:hypothetical protein
MFEKLKQLKQLQELKSVLEKEKKEVEEQGIKVVVNGKMEVEEIKLNSQLDIATQERIVKDCINKGMKDIQMAAAAKMFEIK